MVPSRPQRNARVFVITGGNSGLGFETARLLASASPTNAIILGCRDVARGAAARDAIVGATGNERVRAMRLDLASLASVRAFVDEVRATEPAGVDTLVCNAGISRGSARTVDGLDAVFETNHLGHFALTQLLLDRIQPQGRILVVSSDMHSPPGPGLRWPGADRLAHGGVPSYVRYSFSKLCNLYFTYELSRRLRATGSSVSVAAFNPGLMTDTNFASVPRPVAAVMRRVFVSRLGSLASSSVALAALSTSDRPGDRDGQYFDRTDAASSKSSALSYNLENALDLWDVSSRLVDIG
jgi:NAD(P)-dependent dehydrogenase (short-subunit alcohol dehydrogenase family)